ncbi:hypothetical protein IHE45_20G050200 [Dioscorea alata]|uniref:Uncharacterized protein n=1 Tax=Dioscorea alata TaxID=55571 RepID=A0ACB7TU40_DIOAL|nr:hypothetical protein IHE45_20G050200 [Dioscorea alata]
MDSTGSSSVISRRFWHVTQMDLHFLLRRTKMAGKTISKLLTFHYKDRYFCALSCRYSEPNISFYNPKGIEFSCSNTPEQKKGRRHHHHHHEDLQKYDVKAIAKAFDVLNRRSPVVKVSESPVMVKEEYFEVDHGVGKVDKRAEEFIRSFYEQLRMQQFIDVTPESLHVC